MILHWLMLDFRFAGESQQQMAVCQSASCSSQFITDEEIPYGYWAVGGYNIQLVTQHTVQLFDL
jgi:hypothetical protein